MSDMKVIDIARRMAELGQNKEACKAYILAMQETQEPVVQLEAALYVLQFGEDYKIPYTWLRKLYDLPEYRDQVLPILTEAFYTPNEKQLKARYEKNCRQLQKYPYLFRKDFPEFQDLPIRFYPYDDNGYLPFHRENGAFAPYVNPRNQQITHYFFQDLSKPILAHDIYSQYELEYLRDNVRASEDVAKENHIYLHYTSWEVFCSYLQILNVYPLLDRKKIVFLMEEEESRYPIDFQKEYGIDYSKFPLKPPAFEEYTRLIWHTQLSSDNGGDFFNEIMDGHPNLIMMHSVILEQALDAMEQFRCNFIKTQKIPYRNHGEYSLEKCKWLLASFTSEEVSTPKGQIITTLLTQTDLSNLDLNCRIAPVVFFQPHFFNIQCSLLFDKKNKVQLSSNALEDIHKFKPFFYFPYIKTFTPMRRITTSGAALVRFQKKQHGISIEKDKIRLPITRDAIKERILNRSYMIDRQDRLFIDSILVRFEDGKLNPKATFTALASFLDIPYTKSMTYCSYYGEHDPESLPGNARGFDSRTVFSTYDEFLGKPERYLIEYYMQDVYRHYGYDFHYYDGKSLELSQIDEKAKEITILDRYIVNSIEECYYELERDMKKRTYPEEALHQIDTLPRDTLQSFVDFFMKPTKAFRVKYLHTLYRNFEFFNKNGQPLHFMPMLQLDPELLEQPMYH